LDDSALIEKIDDDGGGTFGAKKITRRIAARSIV